MEYKGKHAICDMILEVFPSNEQLEQAIEESIAYSRMNVVHKSKKEFEPHGETAVWILAESHFTLHTYPEHMYISVDCYTCGNEGDPVLAINRLKELLKPVRTNDIFITRGVI